MTESNRNLLTPEPLLPQLNRSRRIANLVIAIVITVTMVVFVGTVLWVAAEVNSINRTVTSHNTELAKTLNAACVLIRSDPKLPQNDCPPVQK